MNKNKKTKHDLVISLSKEDYKLLVKQAEKEATTKVDVIRRALREFARKN